MKRVIASSIPSMPKTEAWLYVNNYIGDQAYEVYESYAEDVAAGILNLDDLAQMVYEHLEGPNLEDYFDDMEDGSYNFTLKEFRSALKSFRNDIVQEARDELSRYSYK